MRLELDALGADGDVSEPLTLRQRATSEEWCASPPLSVILGAAAEAEEDEGLEASTMRCALHSTPSAQTAMSVRRESRQSEASFGWCGSPPLSVSLGGAVGAALAVRARFRGGMFRWGVIERDIA